MEKSPKSHRIFVVANMLASLQAWGASSTDSTDRPEILPKKTGIGMVVPSTTAALDRNALHKRRGEHLTH